MALRGLMINLGCNSYAWYNTLRSDYSMAMLVCVGLGRGHYFPQIIPNVSNMDGDRGVQ
jgi:hypothetical protein